MTVLGAREYAKANAIFLIHLGRGITNMRQRAEMLSDPVEKAIWHRTADQLEKAAKDS